MTLHLQELAQIERREAEEYSRKYEICPLAFDSCYGARDSEIFERACSRAFKSCSNLQNNSQIIKAEYESKSYVVEFRDAGRSIALSGGLTTC